jgi:replicative DNA helicase
MKALHARTGVIDPIALADELRRSGEIDEVGGAAYIASLFDGVPRFSTLTNYLRLVKDAAISRALISTGNGIAARAVDGSEQPEDMLAQARKEIDEIELSRAVSSGQAGDIAIGEYIAELEELYNSEKPFLGLGTGIYSLDYSMGGFQRGELVVVGARPSMGKTAAAARIIQGMAEYRYNEEPVIVIFSLEMKTSAFMARIVHGLARVDAMRARNKQLTKEEWSRLFAAHAQVAKWKVVVFGLKDANTPAAQNAAIRRVQREHGKVSAVFLDHLGFCSFPGIRTDNRNVLWDEVTRAQKAIALAYNVPFVVLCQLSRANESRADKRPMLSDLRESGGIEQNADAVIFVHRENYYDKAANPILAEWIIAKQRNGVTRTVELRYDEKLAWFDNLERE